MHAEWARSPPPHEDLADDDAELSSLRSVDGYAFEGYCAGNEAASSFNGPDIGRHDMCGAGASGVLAINDRCGAGAMPDLCSIDLRSEKPS